MEWYYTQEGAQFGPFSTADLQEMVATEKLEASVLVWCDGMENWIPFAYVDELSFKQGKEDEGILIPGAEAGKMIKTPTPMDDAVQGRTIGPPKGNLPEKGGNPYHPGVSTEGHHKGTGLGATVDSWDPLIEGRQWVSFIGVISIVGGILFSWTLVGILYIFMGIWLLRGAAALKKLAVGKRQMIAHHASDCLRKYFVLTGYFTLIAFLLHLVVIGYVLFQIFVQKETPTIPAGWLEKLSSLRK